MESAAGSPIPGVGEDIVAGELVRLSPLVQRVTAPNPGPLTGPGTNTYILGREGGPSVIIDAGPAIDTHLDNILQAVPDPAAFLVTHTHADHSPAASILANKTGAPLLGASVDDAFQDKTCQFDREIGDREILSFEGFSIEAIHTPGHVANHFCFLLREEAMLFTGDHIMQGSTVVIVPPGGNMADYMASLALLEHFGIESLAPGHGSLVTDPEAWISYLVRHRQERENKVVTVLGENSGMSLKLLTDIVYDDVPVDLLPVASVSLWAHLLKLEQEGRARPGESQAEFGNQVWYDIGST
jgi:glyoxylase-like metal-dependent hydrolase (beta-lactamase superfamily II)